MAADDRERQSIIRRPGQGVRRPGEISGRRGETPTSAPKKVEPTQSETRQITPKKEPVPVRVPVRVSSRVREEERALNKSEKKDKKAARIILIGLVIVVFLSIFAGLVAYTYMNDLISNPVDASSIIIDDNTAVKFRVNRKESTSSIATRLYELGLIKNKTVFRFLSKFNGYDGTYNAGTHTLSEGLSNEEIMFILSGKPETVRVTFPEGFTTLQIAERLDANDVCTKEEFLNAVQTIDVSSYEFLKGVDFTGRDYRLDGYLFPDTYDFDVLSNVNDIIYKMLNRFNEVFIPAYYDMANNIGLSIDDVVKLASLVEEEARVESERQTIAGVFYNRLKTDDPSLKKLQSTATISYIFKKLYNTKITIELEDYDTVDDPYNTYLYEGLMPGALCNPGLSSIQAALQPEEHDYMYFYTHSDGSGLHDFNVTLAEQKKSIEKWG